MNAIYTYNVADIETNIVTQNISNTEVSNLTGIPRTKISPYCDAGYLYHKRYLITKNGREGNSEPRGYTKEDIEVMQRWDATMQMIRKKVERVS
jgi:hypothetical protein